MTQAAGKVPLDLANVDLASFSAHKLYGPKGIGGLFVRRGVRVEPLVAAAGRSADVRAGTVNVPAVVGFGAALQLRAGGDGGRGHTPRGTARQCCATSILAEHRRHFGEWTHGS
jgi:cysteine sulfinate desulfinase/cysteine desulfurase-like protein